MRLVQFETQEGERRIGVSDRDHNHLQVVNGAQRIYELAVEAARANTTLESLVSNRIEDELVSYEELLAAELILPPINHPDPAHCLVTGTGLSHLGSAQTRDEMHSKLEGAQETLTDSMRMFKLGLDGGKPTSGAIGSQPEWFWKGDGSILVGCGRTLISPSFAKDGGEEAELAGIYIIGENGKPYRLGFALANEFSDHVTEKENYLYLAHSKLRACSLGPELRLGPLPDSVTGTIRVRRNNQILWDGEMLSGEDNMSHAISNLEHHHFKYKLFCRPGDIHVHFFGAGSISFANNIKTEDGDRFEIDVPEFGHPLTNQMRTEKHDTLVKVELL